MNAIAAEAGITKPILYRHFGDRNGLISALTERHTSGLLAAVRAALNEPLERRDRVEHVLDVYLAGIESRPQVYRLITQGGDQGRAAGRRWRPRSSRSPTRSPRPCRPRSTSGRTDRCSPRPGAGRSPAWCWPPGTGRLGRLGARSRRGLLRGVLGGAAAARVGSKRSQPEPGKYSSGQAW
ncbi:hypothetical protein GCM10020229_07150 [Kitasatospora albolonga]